MSTPTWRQPTAVIAQLLNAPQQFGFFQAVRLLERWVGLERLQFHNSVSLSFPASEIEAMQVHWTTAEAVGLTPELVQRVDITPACMGLLGVSGALPLVYTEWLAQSDAKGRNAAALAFLNLFSHRSLMLFYQAWGKHRLCLRQEQEAVREQRAMRAAAAPRAMLAQALALSGMGLNGLRDRLVPEQGGVSDEALAYFAGTLQQRTVPMAQMQRLLSHYLGLPVSLQPFVGRWYPVPQSGRTALGCSGMASQSGLTQLGAASGVLGRSALLGERVWQRDLCVRVVLGPLTRMAFLRCLPGGPGAQALRQWLLLLLGPALDVEVQLRLSRDAVHGMALASSRTPLSGRLGWDTYLLAEPARTDRQDVHYDICPGKPEVDARPSFASSSLSTHTAFA